MGKPLDRISSFLLAWLPAGLRVDAKERWRAVLGAALGICFTGLVSRWVDTTLGFELWLIAPLGASAVLVFAVPASPLAQPWSVIAGNTVSALVGMACAWAIPDLVWAAAAAVALAIALMFFLRCLHPPGGATALLAVLTQASDLRFALLAVLLNSMLLVLAGVIYNSLSGRRYPHVQIAAPVKSAGAVQGPRFSSQDLDVALRHYNQVLDVSRDDLEGLLHEAETAAYQRNLGQLRCADIMSRTPVVVAPEAALEEAWRLMSQHQIKALPVVNRAGQIVGIITRFDLMQQNRASADAKSLGAIQRVEQVMSQSLSIAAPELHIIELLPLFCEGGHHHIPIVAADQRLVGILTQSDLVRALYRAVRPA